jgi:hypothetical protein
MSAFVLHMVACLATELRDSIQTDTVEPAENCEKIRQVLKDMLKPAWFSNSNGWARHSKIAQELLLIKMLEATILDEVWNRTTTPAGLQENPTVHRWQQGFETLWRLLEEAARFKR